MTDTFSVSPRWNSMLLVLLPTLLCIGCRGDDLAPPARGPDWISFRNPSTPQMRCNMINALAEGFDGKMWIATDSGATSFYKSSWGDIHDDLRYPLYSEGVPFDAYKVKALASGLDGSLWLGTAGGGVKRFRDGAATDGWRTYEEPTIAFNTISAIAADEYTYGEVWLATPILGLSRFIPNNSEPLGGTWVNYTLADVPELASNQVHSAAFDPKDNSFWFGTNLAVAAFALGSGWRTLYLPAGITSTVFAMTFDDQNTLWLGLEQGAASYHAPDTFRQFNAATTGGRMPRARVNAVLTDHSFTRWFGTDGGLVRLRDTTWTLFSQATVPQFVSDTVTALCYDRRGNLWIGTTNGIVVFNEEGIAF